MRPYAYFQLTHDGKPTRNANTVAETFGAQSFTGFAVYTDEKASSRRCILSDLDKGKAEHVKQATNGWLGIRAALFRLGLAAARQGIARDYVHAEAPTTACMPGGVMRAAPAPSPPARRRRVKVPLYAGPQEQRQLQAAAPGLDLVVDYGLLAIIAWPLFWLLEKFHALSGNWGVAIILLTVLIKLVFFPLSAASYKSMAKMKLITPRLTKLREMYGERSPEDEPGDDGAVQDREDQSARRLLPDPGADPGVHRALLGAARGDRAAPRAVHAVDQGSVGARSVLRAADPDDGHDGPADAS